MDKVLIVEDDPMVANINKKYLARIMPCEIFGPVTTQSEIIDILNKESIDLILMDEYLPQKNGLEILKFLRMEGFLTQVIMITAANQTEEVQKAYAYGVIDYLVKPFEIERFKQAIEKYDKRQLLLREKHTIKQEDIDQAKIEEKINEDLPKGLNKMTLLRIIEVIHQKPIKEWTLRSLATEVNISNVTVKKYMDYLEATHQVDAHLTTGQIGRPEYRYKALE